MCYYQSLSHYPLYSSVHAVSTFMHMLHVAESQLESGNTNFDSHCLFLSQKMTQSVVSHVILTLSLVSESLTPSDISFLSSSPVLSSSPNRDLLSFPFHLVQVVRVQDYFPLSQMALNKKTSTPDYSSDITQSHTCLMSAAVLHLTTTRTSCVTRVYMHLESFLHSSTRIHGSVMQIGGESKPFTTPLTLWRRPGQRVLNPDWNKPVYCGDKIGLQAHDQLWLDLSGNFPGVY